MAGLRMTEPANGETEMRPRLLDLFCGAGGAAMGYHQAGFDVVGVDIKPQPHYPFEFEWADAFEFLDVYDGRMKFDAIHASPPCQRYSVTRNFTGKGDTHPDLVGPTRMRLQQAGLPWVIENVPGAPLRADYVLCGCMFNLRTGSGMRLERERWFETSWQGFAMVLGHDHSEPAITVAGHDVPSHQRKFGRGVTLAERKAAMGIAWMSRDELGQAIPPAYTRLIGEQLLQHLERVA
jgi:DNA (cytosine-5)-methyltransferase 1